MWRRKDFQIGGLILLAAMTASAQWPSSSYPNKGSYDRGNESLSGAVERLSARVTTNEWKSYITTNLYNPYFSNGSKLKASKDMLSRAITFSSFDNYWDWLYDDTNIEQTNSFTVITTAGLANRAGITSSWWTVHPYVNTAQSSNGYIGIPPIMTNMHSIQGDARLGYFMAASQLVARSISTDINDMTGLNNEIATNQWTSLAVFPVTGSFISYGSFLVTNSPPGRYTRMVVITFSTRALMVTNISTSAASKITLAIKSEDPPRYIPSGFFVDFTPYPAVTNIYDNYGNDNIPASAGIWSAITFPSAYTTQSVFIATNVLWNSDLNLRSLDNLPPDPAGFPFVYFGDIGDGPIEGNSTVRGYRIGSNQANFQRGIVRYLFKYW